VTLAHAILCQPAKRLLKFRVSHLIVSFWKTMVTQFSPITLEHGLGICQHKMQSQDIDTIISCYNNIQTYYILLAV
jgi:hypothetical protein